jgi:SSS family solute:Na+ symporter
MAVDTLTFAVCAVIYVAIVLFLGYLGWKRTKEAEDYMLAGRKVHPVLIALSYGATFISTSAIVGFGGVAAAMGMGIIWLVGLNIFLGILIAFVIYGKKTREIGQRLKAVTFPDLMGKIYNSAFLQYACGLIIVVGMPLYTSAVMIGAGRFIETTFAMDYNLALLIFAAITATFVIFGGMLGVIYNDSFQAIIMLVGMTILLVFAYVSLGGITHAHEMLTNMASLVPAASSAAGMTGWTTMPSIGSAQWLTLVTTIILGVGIGVLAQPQLIVRFMTAKDNKSLNRAVPIGGFFILMLPGVAYTVGALTNVYFYEKMGKLAVAAAGGNTDSVIPLFINMAMPDWFVLIFMFTLLAAAMSTLSSLFHAMGTAAVNDIWGRMRNKKPTLFEIKVFVLAMILVSCALAYIMPGSIIARATAMFMGLCAAAFLPAFTHAIFSKKPSTIAAVASLIVGAVVWFGWTAFVHIKESQPLGISMLLFGKDAVLSMPWQVVDPLVIALPLSIAALALFWGIERFVLAGHGEEAAKKAV